MGYVGRLFLELFFIILLLTGGGLKTNRNYYVYNGAHPIVNTSLLRLYDFSDLNRTIYSNSRAIVI